MRKFSQAILDKIVEEYSATMGDGPMDSDEVEDVVQMLQVQLDLDQGNITEDEFDELTEGWE